MGKNLRFHSMLFVIVSMVFVLIFHYSTAKGAQVSPKRGGVFRMTDGVGGSPLLPWEIHPVTMETIMPAVETLLMMDREGRILPKLAERWEVAQDLNAITLHLRRDVRFHDGSEFNAEAVRWNLNKQLEAGLLPMVQTVRVLGPYTVRLELREWDNRIFALLAERQGLMISPRSYERNGADWARWNPVGTGPFQVVRYERGAGAIYRRFEGYWDKGKPYVDAIEYPFVTDAPTLQSAFLAGRLDLINPGAEVAHELAQRGFPTFSDWNGMFLLIPDSANPNSPFADSRVRLAVWLALNREEIVRARGFGVQQPVYQVAWPGTDAYLSQLVGPRHDPAQAKRLLAEAGYPNGFTSELVAQTATVTAPVEVLQIIQQQLSEVGIRVTIRRLGVAQYLHAITNGWSGLLQYPLTFRANYVQLTGTYWIELAFKSWRRPALLQRAFHEARRTRIPEAIKVKRINQILVKEYDLIPVYVTKSVYVHKPYVRNTGHLKWHYFAIWTPAEVWLDR